MVRSVEEETDFTDLENPPMGEVSGLGDSLRRLLEPFGNFNNEKDHDD